MFLVLPPVSSYKKLLSSQIGLGVSWKHAHLDSHLCILLILLSYLKYLPNKPSVTQLLWFPLGILWWFSW